MTEQHKKIEITIKHYSAGKYLPTYDHELSYDVYNAEEHEYMMAEIGAHIKMVCDANPELTVRVVTKKGE